MARNSSKKQENTTKNGLKLPGLSFDLNQPQRRIIAAILTLVVIVALYGTISWFTNPNFKTFLGYGVKDKEVAVQTSKDQEIIDELETLTKINPEDLVFQTVTLDQLPVYPQAWVERYFNNSERLNSLISGPSADPDKDGLSNKEEYLYGSDPRKADTLCDGKQDRPECKGKNDGQNVQAGISPLTGLSLDAIRSFKIKREDYQVLDRVKDSFEQQAKEGIDFPTLYQLSRTIDLSGEYNAITANVQDDTRENILNYSQKRLDLINSFVNDDELTNFIDIYKITKPDDLVKVQQKYEQQRDKLQDLVVPNRYASSHKAYVLLFDKLITLIQHRENGLRQSSVFTDDFKAESKKKAIEVVWAYRKVNEETAKLPVLT